MKRLKRDKRAVSNAIVVMLSLVLVVIIVANVVLWSYQMNQLDWEKMQEKLEITNIERITRSPWFTCRSEYTIDSGSHVNGTYTNTWTADDVYETFREEPSSNTTTYPVTNMNFTGNENGWSTTSISYGTPYSGYNSADGNPSPGSGAGCYYHNATSSQAKAADINFTTETSFTYNIGTPISVALSYAYSLEGNSFGNGSNLIIRLVKPDLTTVDLDTVSLPASAVAWRYKTGITVDPTHFSQSGTYKLQVINRLVAGAKGKEEYIQLNFDDIGLAITYYNEYHLNITGEFVLDTSTHPLTYVKSIEIQICYRANDTLENWFLKAYNWTSGQYTDTGFNSTDGHTPTNTTEFEYYAVNLTDAWQSYVCNNGTIRVKFCDANPDADQTTIDIDFFGIRAVIDGTRFSIKNDGASTLHIVSIWIINSTYHKRYGANFFINSGESATYTRADIPLPTENFVVKVVTERGNIAVLARH